MIRWGIIGAGNIAARFAASLYHEQDGCLLAVSCRTLEKAEQFAAAHGAAKAYGSYEALLSDPEVDAVYLALPHGLHKQWAIRAMEAGKSVLCEKPAGLNADEVWQMAQAAEANHVLFMEGMKSRFVPLYGKIKELLREGVIGELQRIDTSLCNEIPFDDLGPWGKTYHTQPGHGGSLLDSGIYCASWIEDLTASDITRIRLAACLRDGIDVYLDASLQIGSLRATLETAFDRAKPRTVVLIGTTGELRVEELHRTQMAELYRGGIVAETFTAPYVFDDFYGEIHHFTQCLQSGLKESPVMSLAASIRCANILDVIREGFSYDDRDLAVLEQQEQILQYDTFGSTEAWKLGRAIVRQSISYEREIAVQILREQDGMVMFQFVMDSKSEKNLQYMAAKRVAAKRCGHSSLWAYVEHALHGEYQELFDDIPNCLPCAGAFPIRDSSGWTATVMVSGLHEGLDHELITRALGAVLCTEVPLFTKITV